jgi:ribosomal protein S18 acetylase RimI-like enzyme
VTVEHTLYLHEKRFIDTSEALWLGSSHIFRAKISLHDFAISVAGGARKRVRKFRDDDDAERELWDGLRSYAASGYALGSWRGDRELLVADVSVDEVPARLVAEAVGSWPQYLEDVYAAPELTDVIVRSMEVDDGRTLRHPLRDGGSLLSLSQLQVHPKLRGQALGLRLVAHAMWELVRHPGDLAVLQAHPTETIFDAWEERQRHRVKAEDVQRVVDYFERLGFYRAEPDAPVTRTSLVAMFRQVGTFGLPFAGLGALSAVPVTENVQ